MNKELTITNEDIELLKEMKNNCLKSDIYNDEKRLLKANAITKFLLLQQENKELHNKIDEAIDYIRDCCNMDSKWTNLHFNYAQSDMLAGQVDDLLEILKDSDVVE